VATAPSGWNTASGTIEPIVGVAAGAAVGEAGLEGGAGVRGLEATDVAGAVIGVAACGPDVVAHAATMIDRLTAAAPTRDERGDRERRKSIAASSVTYR